MSTCDDHAAAAAPIAATIESLPEPQRDVLVHHTLNPDAPSIAALSRERGVPYNRMLKHEHQARSRLTEACRTPIIQKITGTAEQVVTSVLPLRRLLHRIPALRNNIQGIPLWRILTATTMHLWERDGWVAPQPVENAAADCAAAITALMDEHRTAPLFVIADDLPPQLHGDDAARWLAYCGYTVRSGYVLAPPKKLADHAVQHLAVTGVPCHFDEIYHHIGSGKTRTWVCTAMWRDPRLMKCDVRTWALAAWGIEPYTSITGLIRAQLEAANGPLPLRELVAAITSRSEVARKSVYEFAAKPPFTLVDGTVRLHGAADRRKEHR